MQRRQFIKSTTVAGLAFATLPVSAHLVNEDVGYNRPPLSSGLEWGVAAITLGKGLSSPFITGVGATLPEPKKWVGIDRFYRLGGENAPITPTKVYIGWDASALHVLFRCEEPYPKNRFHDHGVPMSEMANDLRRMDSNYPDRVDLWIRPEWKGASYYQFSLSLQGNKTGQHFAAVSKLSARETGVVNKYKPVMVDNFEGQTKLTDTGWMALISVPWIAIGGKPTAPFGLLLNRSRWRTSERLSPVGIDFDDAPALDLFMEADFGSRPKVYVYKKPLVKLPSGFLRWQKPALLSWPAHSERQEIWKLQEDLKTDTTPENFSNRVRVMQRWADMMVLEGFDFRERSGSPIKKNLFPSAVRQTVNQNLVQGKVNEACKQLHGYLRELDEVSRVWFADQSPGNIRDNEWIRLSALEAISLKPQEVLLTYRTDSRPINLYISFPKQGGVRIHNGTKGYFEPKALDLIQEKTSGSQTTISTSRYIVDIHKDSGAIYINNPNGDKLWQLLKEDIAILINNEHEVLAVDISGRLQSEEVVYGFGERFDTFNQRGNILTLWGMDNYQSITVGLRNEAYKPIPLFHSSRGYTLFVNSSYRMRADMGNGDPKKYRLTQHGPILDFYVWPANPQDAWLAFTDLTGKPLLPPQWSFEPWMGGTSGRWSSGPLKDPVAQMLQVTHRFRELDIPHPVIYAEGGGSDSPRLHKEMFALGIKPLAWMNSSISMEKQKVLMPKTDPQDLPFLRLKDGKPYVSKHAEYIDFSHPKSQELLSAFWQKRLDLGIAGSMVDFGDQVPEDALFYNGKDGKEMHNFYHYGYHKGFHDVFSERLGADHVLFGRAASPGTQQWVCQFAGDHRANFTGLKAAFLGGINLSTSGFSNWGSDLGGFYGWPDPEVYARWVAFGCFSPFMRCHGTEPREPWEYGDEMISVYKHFVWLRKNLLEYICNAAAEANETGFPLMRALPMAYPEEKWLARCDDEYMFGPDLLVAPLLKEGGKRKILFPSGRWTNLWNGEAIQGPVEQTVSATFLEIPVYLREGALMPVQLNKTLQWGASMTDNRVPAMVVTIPKAEVATKCREGKAVKATIIAKPIDEGFTIQMKGRADMRYLLLYGAKLKKVSVNGDILPQLEVKEIEVSPPGWYEKQGQIVIRLPHALYRDINIECTPVLKGILDIET